MNDTVKLALTNSAVLFGIAMVSALLTDFAKTQRLPSIECLYYAFLTALLAFFVTLGHAKKRARARKKIRRLYQTTDQDIQKLKQSLKPNKMDSLDYSNIKTLIQEIDRPIERAKKTSGPTTFRSHQRLMHPIYVNSRPPRTEKTGRYKLDYNDFLNNDHDLLCVVI
jgi:hypothetical protein